MEEALLLLLPFRTDDDVFDQERGTVVEGRERDIMGGDDEGKEEEEEGESWIIEKPIHPVLMTVQGHIIHNELHAL